MEKFNVNEEELNDEVRDLIEELTTTGEPDLDILHMKKLKTCCRKSKVVLENAFNTLMEQLEKPHAEIRFSTFQIIVELFSRSHLFRILVGKNLYNIFLYTVETDTTNNPLPPPFKTSKKLKLFVLRHINLWNKKYGSYYRRIALGYEYLRDVKNVNFKVIRAKLKEEELKEKEQKEKEEQLAKSKLDQVDMQIQDMYDNIMKNLKEIETCFELLCPNMEAQHDLKSEDIEEDDNDIDYPEIETEGKNEDVEYGLIGSETGLQGKNFKMTIEISTHIEIIEDENNTDLIKRMDELYDELEQQKYIVKRWLKTLMKYCTPDKEKVKKTMDLGKHLNTIRKKYLEMKILRIKRSNDSDDDDFVDVPEKSSNMKSDGSKNIPSSKEKSSSDATNNIPEKEKGISSLESSTSFIKRCSVDKPPNIAPPAKEENETLEQQSSSINFDAAGMSNASSFSELNRKERLMKIAPVVPFDVDLEYWGKEVKPIASIKLDSQHRFWKTSEHVEEFVPPDVVEAMRTRVMSFPVKFKPVERKCGALLSTGKFCERMDRYKCPFHGKIVERDDKGMPTNSELLRNEISQNEEKDKTEVISAMPPYIKKKRTKKHRNKNETPEDRHKLRYARLTCIKSEKDVSKGKKTKIERKVFNSRALKKVNESMDAVIKKKHLDKFGESFNYH